MAGANGDCPAWPTLQVASNPLRSIRPTASTIRWTISSSGNQSIISTGSRKRWRRSGSRKKWAIDTPPRQRTWTESCCRGDVNREKGRLGPSPQRQAAILQQPLKVGLFGLPDEEGGGSPALPVTSAGASLAGRGTVLRRLAPGRFIHP